jgi:NADPH:quinone reductase-like Zn-dependent oxidoreductase
MPTAVVATAFGGPEVLSLVEVPLCPPGPGEAHIEVRAAGANPVDYKSYASAPDRDPSKLPMRLGYEVAGIVLAVGEDADGPAGALNVGDKVVAYPVAGAYATEVVTKASNVLPKPASLSFEQAGGLLLTGTAAYQTVHVTKVGAGDTVVVHGGAGGVGLMVVQIAVAANARVIATASESGHAELRKLGAEPVEYGSGLADRIRSLAPQGVDVAIDTVGSDEAIDTSLELVGDRERIATIAAFKRGSEAGIKFVGDPGPAGRAAAALELLRLVGEGSLKVFVAATYPLSDAAEAHEALASRHTHGKIILVP